MGKYDLRTYTRKGAKKGQKRLATWTQDKCVICKRFLSKHQIKFCAKHATRKEDYLRSREYRIKESKNRYYVNREEINRKRREKRRNKV